jgi:hypothetical protein
MTRARTRHRRPAYVAGMALVFSSLLLVFLLVLADYTTTDRAQQQQTLLEARAEQIVQSARAWSRQHVEELAGAAPVSLSVDQLVPPETSSALELALVHTDGDPMRVQCTLRLRRGQATAYRQAHWPLVTPGSAPE